MASADVFYGDTAVIWTEYLVGLVMEADKVFLGILTEYSTIARRKHPNIRFDYSRKNAIINLN